MGCNTRALIMNCLPQIFWCFTFTQLLGAIALAALPTAPDAIYKAYTRDARAGMTKAEFQRYLKDYTLSPSLKRLYDDGNNSARQEQIGT